jgi:hypothetical protein
MKKLYAFIAIMAVVPWITVPLLGKRDMKRFLPGAIFMAIYVLAEGRVAEKRKWWWFPFKTRPNVLGEMPLILGPFFVGSLWILKYTYGKFNLYLLINVIIDSLFTYPMLEWFKKMGYCSLLRLSKIRLSLLFMIKSVFMYGFQVVFEKLFYRNRLT